MQAQVHESRLQNWERKLATEYRISAKEFQNKLIHEQKEAKLRAARNPTRITLDWTSQG